MLKPYLLCSAALLFGLVPALAWGQTPQNAAPSQAPAAAPATAIKNPAKPTAESQAKAKSLYAIDCAMCHGDNGNGQTDMAKSMSLKLNDWTDPNSLANKQDGDLFKIIRDGKEPMPPEAEGRASDNMVWNLIHYIRTFSKSRAAASAQ